MAIVTLKGHEVQTVGDLPQIGAFCPDFRLVTVDLTETTLADYKGKRLVLNIFPSVDTGVCAQSVREFNQSLSTLDNTVVLCVAADLPFAMSRFCGAEGLDRVVMASSFRASFGQDFGVTFSTGPLAELLSRAVLVVDTNGKIIHAEQVPEITQEPDYQAALASLA